MVRRTQKYLRRSAIAKKQHNASSRRFEKFESVHSLSLSRHDCMYLQKLTLCEECYKDLLPHILIDLIGEEFDNLVDIDDEKEEELEDINVSLKHISNFWNGTNNWTEVNLSFPELLFMFDNSQNHHKKSPDGLCANALNLSDGGKNVPK